MLQRPCLIDLFQAWKLNVVLLYSSFNIAHISLHQKLCGDLCCAESRHEHRHYLHECQNAAYLHNKIRHAVFSDFDTWRT